MHWLNLLLTAGDQDVHWLNLLLTAGDQDVHWLIYLCQTFICHDFVLLCVYVWSQKIDTSCFVAVDGKK